MIILQMMQFHLSKVFLKKLPIHLVRSVLREMHL